MKTINFVCPHCSHSMTLPAVLEGKAGNCSSCKSSVTVVGSRGIETIASKSTITEPVAESPTNAVLPTQGTNSIASPDTNAIRERLTRLQTAKQEYEQADALQIQAAGKLQDAKAAVSTVFDPIGSSVVLAYTCGEINDTPLLGNVLEANRKLQQLQHDLAALEPAPDANIIQKTKVKAQRVILNQKIKQTEKQIIDYQFELGKNIFESKDYAFVACDTTKSALERLATIQANIVEAENNLQLAISSFVNLKTELMASVPLNSIEGTQTFDIAIGVSERQLAAIQSPAQPLQSPTAEAPPLEPTPQTALGDPSEINVNPTSQPLSQQTSQNRDRSGNRTKSVIAASVFGIVILLIAGSLYIFLAGSGNTNNDNSANVETANRTFSPRSEFRSAISDLESKFKAALLASNQHDRIQDSEGTSPKFQSNANKGVLQWDGVGVEFTRLSVEIVDHDFDSADGLGEIVFEVDYSYLFSDGVSGGLDKRYTVSFLVENNGFVLEKVTKAERSRRPGRNEFGSEKIYSHQSDPTIEVLLGNFIQF
jgi:hypothetical protein